MKTYWDLKQELKNRQKEELVEVSRIGKAAVIAIASQHKSHATQIKASIQKIRQKTARMKLESDIGMKVDLLADAVDALALTILGKVQLSIDEMNALLAIGLTTADTRTVLRNKKGKRNERR